MKKEPQKEINVGFCGIGMFDLDEGLMFETYSISDNSRQILMREFVSFKEECIKDKLISLGWKPPKDKQ